MSAGTASTRRTRGDKAAPERGKGKANGAAEAQRNSETRLQIIEAAKRCFAEHGYSGTTNKMLAVEAGVAPGLIYYYFESKEHVFIAVFDQMYEARNQRLAGYDFAEHSLSENVSRMLDDSIQLAHEDPSFVDVFTLSGREVSRNPGLEQAWNTHWERVVHVYFRIVEAAVERGEVPRAHQAGLIDMLVAFFSGLLMWVSRQPDQVKVHQATDQFLRLVDAYVGTAASSKGAAKAGRSKAGVTSRSRANTPSR